MKALIVFALLAAAAPVTLSNAQSEDERDVARVTTEYEDAIRQRDASTHERLFAEDYTYTPGNGNFMNRKAHMAFTRSGVVSVESFQSVDRLVRVYGTAAVVTGAWVTEVLGRDAEAPAARRIRYLLVYAKRDGRWQMVAEQRTKIGADVVIREQ
jgi:uncharacterized protein (TIGR02246 family)